MDPDVAYRWLVAQIAERFHVLPSVAARDLAEDPDRLSLESLPLLGYAEAYRAYQRNDKNEMKRWRGSRFMDLVKEIDLELVEAELGGSMEDEG